MIGVCFAAKYYHQSMSGKIYNTQQYYKQHTLEEYNKAYQIHIQPKTPYQEAYQLQKTKSKIPF